MNTSTAITIIETIIMTRDNTTLESSKINSNENEISKLNSAWNNYDKRLR